MREEDLPYRGLDGIPVIREPGSAARVSREGWRLVRPVHHREKCTKCKICFTYCPDAAIIWTADGPDINYTACKGCMICMEECPADAMTEEKEGEI